MWERRIRLWSGLLVALFVIPHIINHALGLVSFEAMEAMRKVLSAIWAGPLGGPILLLAFLVHFVFSLHALFKRSTLRMPPWEAAQIALGIAIFPLILTHIAGTAVAGQMLGFDPTYEYVIAALLGVGARQRDPTDRRPHRGLGSSLRRAAFFGCDSNLGIRAGYRSSMAPRF